MTEEEAKATHAKGFRQVTGSILWPMRCTRPELAYAAIAVRKVEVVLKEYSCKRTVPVCTPVHAYYSS
eukprot:COSAG05_NODE_17546_length_323_cov_1.084821_1_plen_68_part_00